MDPARTLRLAATSLFVSSLAFAVGGCDDDPSGPSEDPWSEAHLVFASTRVGTDDPPSTGKDLFRITLDGVHAERLTHEPTNGVRALHLSPDGRRLVMEATWEFGCPNIWTMAPDGSDATPLTTGGVQRCNERPKWSPDGTQIAFTSSREPSRWGWSAWVMGADGSNPTLIPADSANTDRSDWIQAWTPDGRVVLSSYLESDGTDDIWTYLVNPDGTGFERFFETPEDLTPYWSPDGTAVAFVSLRDGNREIYLMDADGSNVRRLTHDSGADDFRWLGPSPWSPDGRWLAFHSTRSGSQQIHLASLVDGSVRQLTSEPQYARFSGWSPDGSAVAFESSRSGNREILVVGAEGGGLRNVTSHSADDGPAVWVGGG